MRRGRRDEGGQVTAFVTMFMVALVFVAGLVVDGGRLIAAKRRADNRAEQAARAGAQAVSIDVIRSSGAQVLDEDKPSPPPTPSWPESAPEGR